MFAHQQSFAKTLLEVYEPISGKYLQVNSLLRRAGKYAPQSPVQQQLQLMPMPQSTKRSRPVTPEASMRRAQDFHAASDAVSTSHVPQLELKIERQVIAPCTEWMQLHKKVDKVLTKREHKRIDYERHTESVTKLKAAAESTSDHHSKLSKLEQSVDMAQRDFSAINDTLKMQLPQYISLRTQVVDPIVESLIDFQLQLFTQMYAVYHEMSVQVDMSTSAVDGFMAKKAQTDQLMSDISILQPGRLSTVPASNLLMDAQQDSRLTQEFDHESSPPPYIQPVSNNNPFNHSTSQDPPALTTNPFDRPFGQVAGPAKHVRSNVSSPAATRSSNVPLKVAQKPPPPAVKPKPTLLQQSQQNAVMNAVYPQLVAAKSTPKTTLPKTSTSAVVYALFDYDAQQQGDLSFKKGDSIQVLDRTQQVDGWWRGRHSQTGKEGIFPGNYVQ